MTENEIISERVDVELVQPRSVADIKAAREARTSEALKLKDDQLSILLEQNKKLLESLDKVEEESTALQLEKIATEDENRTLRETSLQAQTRARVAESELDKAQLDSENKGKQLETLTERNGELLRLLEVEESQNSQISSEYESCRAQLVDIRIKYDSLVEENKHKIEAANQECREGKLLFDEVRILKEEVDKLSSQNAELKIKMSVELDSLQEQLRVRKEKQYILLQKLQSQEDIRRRAEDEVRTMEERIKILERRSKETDAQLQIEVKSKSNHEEINRKLANESEGLSEVNRDLSSKLQQAEQERLRMQAEARDSADQLREMAEKVFQLLERLKLAELGKNRSLDAMRSKEQEVFGLKRKQAFLLKEIEKERKARSKAELDRKGEQDQIRALKKHNTQLALRCKEEAKHKLKEEEEKHIALEKIRSMDGRIAFLVNKLQSDEESRKIQKEEAKKLENQMKIQSLEKESLIIKINELESQNRCITEELNVKNDKLQKVTINLESFRRAADELEDEERRQQQKNRKTQENNKKNDSTNLAEGRTRFFIDNKSCSGGILIKAKCSSDRDWLESQDCNQILKKALKTQNIRETLSQKIAELYGVCLTKEEEVTKLQMKVDSKEADRNNFQKENSLLHRKICIEEESKRKVLLKYLSAVKAFVSLGEPGCEKAREEVGYVGSGRLLLQEMNLMDEEVHLIASALKGNVTIAELNMRSNEITDDGARAIAALFTAPSTLTSIDLRDNYISRIGLRSIAEALERSERVKRVHIQAGGRIEAFSSISKKDPNSSEQITSVEIVCVVDVRSNRPPEDPFSELRCLMPSDNVHPDLISKQRLKKAPHKPKCRQTNKETKAIVCHTDRSKQTYISNRPHKRPISSIVPKSSEGNDDLKHEVGCSEYSHDCQVVLYDSPPIKENIVVLDTGPPIEHRNRG